MESNQATSSIEQFLAEAGRVLSAANEEKLRTALESLQAVLEQLAVTAEVAESVGGDCVPLVERAVRRDGTVPIKIIQPGWGSSGYYPKNVLERDIPRAFPPGTQMFWNHATPTEEAERPEGNLDHLAGVLVSRPQWQEAGAKGPGMYADARVFGDYAQTIDEIGEHIGVSIRGSGVHEIGERDGRKGRVIKEITGGKSVDFVTIPGAGGAIVQIFESVGKFPARSNSSARPFVEPTAANLTEVSMSEEALKEAQSKITVLENARQNDQAVIESMRERLILSEAKEFVSGKLAAAYLPEVTKTRLLRQLLNNPPIKEGRIDTETYGKMVETAVSETAKEIAAILGDDGKITGMGGATQQQVPNLAESQKRTALALERLGYGGVANGN